MGVSHSHEKNGKAEGTHRVILARFIDCDQPQIHAWEEGDVHRDDDVRREWVVRKREWIVRTRRGCWRGDVPRSDHDLRRCRLLRHFFNGVFWRSRLWLAFRRVFARQTNGPCINHH